MSEQNKQYLQFIPMTFQQCEIFRLQTTAPRSCWSSAERVGFVDLHNGFV